MGVNVFDRRALRHIRPNEALGIPELIGRILQAKETVSGFRTKTEWLDIGRPEDYEAVQTIFSSPRKRARYFHGKL